MAAKRIVTELTGDQGTDVEVMYASLGLSSLPKKQADGIFCDLAISALQKIIIDCSNETGKKYPDHAGVKAFMEKINIKPDVADVEV
jgi:hypothetical protein